MDFVDGTLSTWCMPGAIQLLSNATEVPGRSGDELVRMLVQSLSVSSNKGEVKVSDWKLLNSML